MKMSSPAYRSQVQASGTESASVVFSGFDPGTYYWRVTPVYPRDYEGSPRQSRISLFRVEKADSLAIPEALDRQGTVYLEGVEQTYFSWKQEDEAAYYTFLLSRLQDLSDPRIERQVRDNYYALNIMEAGLVPGEYYWGVFQTDAEGNRSGFSRARTLVIMAGAPPPRQSPAAPLPSVVSPPPTAPELPVQPELPVEEQTPAAAPPSRPPVQGLLPAPENLQPQAGFTLTEEIIIRDRQLVFSWDAVQGAAEYSFALYQESRELLRRNITQPSFTLTDLSILDNGEFTWRVEAQARGRENAGANRNGSSESRFRVSVGEATAAQGQEGGVIFGRE
jgi:hypothetical protein